jgi:PIN domain nuclease of toxin-antitoxin system
MSALVADTHAVIWYLLKAAKLSVEALAALDTATQEGEPIYLASISLVEVIYLTEKGKLPQVALERLNAALTEPEAGFVLVPLDGSIIQAVQQIPGDVVPEMPDRIIAATAFYLNLPLVTRDLRIQMLDVISTVW